MIYDITHCRDFVSISLNLITDCAETPLQYDFVESNKECKYKFGQEYKYFDYKYDSEDRKYKKYICCKPKPGNLQEYCELFRITQFDFSQSAS